MPKPKRRKKSPPKCSEKVFEKEFEDGTGYTLKFRDEGSGLSDDPRCRFVSLTAVGNDGLTLVQVCVHCDKVLVDKGMGWKVEVN